MEIEQLFQNYKDGGNNYVLKADSANRWTGFNKKTIDLLKSKYKQQFNLVIWGTKSESDFYCIPFATVEHLFTEEHMTKGELAEQGNARWTATITNHVFKMHANSMYSINIERFYGNKSPDLPKTFTELDEIYDVDFTIEDAKANVKMRLGQSSFRHAVLSNFSETCCLSGVSETSLLVASHIVPWAVNKNYRSDPSNGLCFFVEIDAYFDKGYISIDSDLKVIITKRLGELSIPLQERIKALAGKQISSPNKYRIKNEYLEYHQKYILLK